MLETAIRRVGNISIHALREEGDQGQQRILSPRRGISIHALREEGDSSTRSIWRTTASFLSTPSARRATFGRRTFYGCHGNFYPRPPRGGRPGRRGPSWRGLSDFYPRPPRGGRHTGRLSPLTLINFYPRPPRGGRPAAIAARRPLSNDFYPRPPRGGRQQKQRENTLLLSHYTPLCTNCKEMLAKQTAKSHRYLRKRLVFRCEASRKTMCAAGSHWPDIKRSARCLGQILGAVQRARPSSGSCCPAGRTADCPRRGRSGRSALL